MMLKPYGIDGNGKPLNSHPVIDAIYHPNKEWSGAHFREILAVMALVHPKVYVLVWRKNGSQVAPAGKTTPNNIAGFTILEGASVVIQNGRKTYHVNGATYTDADVIEISAGVDPYRLNAGYSPTSAVNKWAKLDDYILAYQTGYFENGAVPAGQFIITAPTADEFNHIVDAMQAQHRGAGRNNNVIYTHRPINSITGSPEEAQIQWVPFSGKNSELSMAELFEQASQRIDSTFGVPASIRGVNDNNTYASVRVDEQIFIRYTVEPFATKIWTQFTQELNRITGGLGFALVFDIDIPGVAEEEKMEAERKSVELGILTQAINAGYSLDSVVDAFDLPNSYKLLKMENKTPEIINHKPEVDEGGEVEEAPDGTAEQSKAIKTKALEDYKENSDIIRQIIERTRAVSAEQIADAIKGVKTKAEGDDETPDYSEKLAEELSGVLVAYYITTGKLSYALGVSMLKEHGVAFTPTPGQGFSFTREYMQKYYDYLLNVGESYTKETAEQIRRVLAEAYAEGLDKEQIADRLRGLVDGEERRAQRLARTEAHRTFGDSRALAMRQLAEQSGTQIYKVWRSNVGDPCEYCRAMDGKRVAVHDNFLAVGESVNGKDGGTFHNNFVDVESACLHPHCMCYVKYEVAR